MDVPIISGDPVAAWTAETEEKPVSRSAFGSKNIKGYTLVVIEPFSNQFRRDLSSTVLVVDLGVVAIGVWTGWNHVPVAR